MGKKKEIKIRYSNFIFVFTVIFMVGFILGTHLSPLKEKIVEKEIVRYITNTTGERSVEMLVPAVNADGNGVAAKLITTVRPGSGSLLVSVNDVLAQYDTQLSGRMAAEVAGNYTGKDMNSYDVIYSIEVNASAIEGPSAGAAMTVSIISALQGMVLNKSVMITGAIYEDGTIGQAGAIYEKMLAAKDNGITTFLIPVNQSIDYAVKRDKKCEMLGKTEYCKINYIHDRSIIGDEINMTVIEVGNIGDAVKYFFLK
ncbi:MAG: S16 family serine protease [Candidatus Aenigmatarchaeota archaeon]